MNESFTLIFITSKEQKQELSIRQYKHASLFVLVSLTATFMKHVYTEDALRNQVLLDKDKWAILIR